jgi:hypothetical protein
MCTHVGQKGFFVETPIRSAEITSIVNPLYDIRHSKADFRQIGNQIESAVILSNLKVPDLSPDQAIELRFISTVPMMEAMFDDRVDTPTTAFRFAEAIGATL